MSIDVPFDQTEYGYTSWTGDNSETDFTVGFPYLNKASAQNGSQPNTLYVYLDGVVQSADWSVRSAGNVIRFDTAPGDGVHIEFKRDSGIDDPTVQWSNRSPITQRNLSSDQNWHKYLDQELQLRFIAALEEINEIIAESAGLNGYVMVDWDGDDFLVADHTSRVPNGDARGANAVDLQMSRSNDDEVAAGIGSLIAGGEDNQVLEDHGAVIGGRQGTSRRYGELAYGAASAAEVQAVQNVASAKTTDATLTELGYYNDSDSFANGAVDEATIPFPAAGTYILQFSGFVVGMRAETSDTAVCFEIKGAMKKNSGGTVSFIGTPRVLVVDTDDAALDVDVDLAAADAGARVRVQGKSGETYVWAFQWVGTEIEVPAL